MPLASWARLVALFFFALVVQIAFLNQIVVSGVHPDLMVILPVAAGLTAGAQRGAAIGFVAGLVARASSSAQATAAETVSCAVLSTATMALYVLIGTIIGQSGLLSSQTLAALAMVGVSALVLSYPVLRLTAGAMRGASSSHSVPSGGSALS